MEKIEWGSPEFQGEEVFVGTGTGTLFIDSIGKSWVGRSISLSVSLSLSLSLYVVGTEWPASICIVILLVAKHVQIMSGTRVLELLTESGRH